ncbi:hypothetical protein RUND412_011662 [Rhizina undulata]
MSQTTSIRQFLLRARVAQPKQLPAFSFVRHKTAGQAHMAMPHVKAQPSTRIVSKEHGETPGDIGLLQGTFVMPTGRNLPSMFTSPRQRLRLEMHRLKQRFLDVRDMAVFRWQSKMKLKVFEPKAIATALHRDMYTAFAEGDLESLRLICGDGLLESFKKRIAARGRNGSKMQWRLVKMIKRPRIVSNKAHYYVGMNMDRRQAVVRIHSLQSLTKLDNKGEAIPGTGEPKEVLEYVVVEKRASGGTESRWYVWGTTEETTLERLETQQANERAALGL